MNSKQRFANKNTTILCLFVFRVIDGTCRIRFFNLANEIVPSIANIELVEQMEHLLSFVAHNSL